MKIEIVTPETTVYQGEASLIQLPGYDGLFEVLGNHAPMITFLGKGNVKLIDEQNKTLNFDLDGGVVEVLQNKVLVLAETCKIK